MAVESQVGRQVGGWAEGVGGAMIAIFLQALQGLQVGGGSRSYQGEEAVNHCVRKTVMVRAVAVGSYGSRVSKQFVT